MKFTNIKGLKNLRISTVAVIIPPSNDVYYGGLDTPPDTVVYYGSINDPVDNYVDYGSI